MKFLTLAVTALSAISSAYAAWNEDPALGQALPGRIECHLRPHTVKKFRKGIVGINVFGDAYDKILLSESDGHALLYDTVSERIEKRLLLAPAHKESCDNTESVEYDSMSVSFCPRLLQNTGTSQTPWLGNGFPFRNQEKTLFNYHVVGSHSPSVAYANRVNDRFFCEIFPKHEPHPQSLAHLPLVGMLSSSFRHTSFGNGDLVFMVDYDRNELLVQIGTTKDDCDNPLTRRCFPCKITSFATCCLFPIVFVGFEDGFVHAYYFKSHPHSCHGKLVCIYKIPPPCSCKCVPPIPIGIQLCCYFGETAVDGPRAVQNQVVNPEILVSVLYRKQGRSDSNDEDRDDNKVKTFLKIDLLSFSFDLYGRRGSLINRKHIGTISNSVIESFIVCCPPTLIGVNHNNVFVYLLIRDCDDRVFLALYSITGRFISKKLLPCKAKILSWTAAACANRIPIPPTKNIFADQAQLVVPTCCCAYILFELPPPCDDCDRCPPKSALVRYCCEEPRQIIWEDRQKEIGFDEDF